MSDSVDQKAHIWRYMSVHEFLTLIVGKKLGFRQFKSMWANDRQEGMVPDGFWRHGKARRPLLPMNRMMNGKRRVRKGSENIFTMYM